MHSIANGTLQRGLTCCLDAASCRKAAGGSTIVVSLLNVPLQEEAMSFPQVLGVVIGLVLIYYILGAIVSTITQILNESFETRGAALEMYLQKIAGDKTIDLTNLPQIKALRPIRYVNW